VIRGGSGSRGAAACRSGARLRLLSGHQGNDVGFRVVLGPVQPVR
jgi:formylglycine-generating enzyme required for sulfatase activity